MCFFDFENNENNDQNDGFDPWDEDLKPNTEVWRMLHPYDYNAQDLEDPWGRQWREEHDW